jgi:hypothetical protein
MRTGPVSLATLLPGLALLALVHSPASGQVSELVLEMGGSQVRPPVDVEGSPASFFVGGLRASRFLGLGSYVQASLLVGRSLDDTASGDFLSGEVGTSLWGHLIDGWAVGTEVRAFGFDVGGAFPYRAGGAEGSVAVRYRKPAVTTQIAAGAGWGRSRVELRRYADGPVALVTDELWRYGGTADVLVGAGPVAVGLSGGVHESAGGRYRSLGGRLVAATGRTAMELRVDAWRTPVGTETTGGLALVIPVGGAWILRGFLGRSEPDPLTLAEPGNAGGGLLVGRRVAGSVYSAGGTSLHQVMEATDGGRVVRFTLRDAEAGSVEVLGDFTLWEPVSMTKKGDRWSAELTVREGTHHFGFLVDGAWYLPDDTQDAVPDEWGRMSATLVVDTSTPASGYAPEPGGAGR